MQQNPINISTSFNLLANNTSIVFLNQIHNQHDCLVEPKSYMFVNKKTHQTDVYIYIFKQTSNSYYNIIDFPYLFYLSFSRDLKKDVIHLNFGKRKNGISGHPGASRPCCYEAAVQERFNRAADVAEVGVTRRMFVLWSYPYGWWGG